MLGTEDLTRLQGADLVDSSGDKIGSVDDIYVDDDTGQPEFALVKTGIFGGSRFVPLQNAGQDGDTIRVSFSKDQVKSSPDVAADGELSQQEEARIYSHYGLSYSESRSDSGLPEGAGTGDVVDTRTDTVGRDTSGPTTDDAMTRSEEELRVGTAERETGRARLRKYIVTEDVQTTVPVQREEVRLEREPITDANRDEALAGPELSEEEHEVTLRAEEPVVEKRVVPKERVRLEKDTYTEEQQVTDQVRKEQIESDTDLDTRRGA